MKRYAIEKAGKLNVHFSSKSDEWATPQWLYDHLEREFLFSLDPCASAENAKCERFFTKKEDGLKQSWCDKTVFMNPPYGRAIGLFVKKAFDETTEGATCVCLLPARTDTRWFHGYCMKGEIRFLRGRLHFGNCPTPAPFPSMIVVFRPRALKIGAIARPEIPLLGLCPHVVSHEQN
jgi:phage N-6-adenine-methyltransferase